MTDKRNEHNSLDGFISRRPHDIDSPVEHKPAVLKYNNHALRSTRRKQLDKAHDIEQTNVGEISFDNEQPVEIERPEPPKKGKWRKLAGRRRGDHKRWSKRKKITVACIVIVLIIAGLLGYKFFANFMKLFNGNPFSIFSTTRLKGEDVGRVNILLAGNSADDPGHDGANLTDSIMLVSLDTIHHTAVMISIPRDLWVDYQTTGCSVGYQGKINAAYECGRETKFNEPGYPKGGMGLLEKIVHDNLGVNINYYALINYTAFHDAVNAVGGISIDLQTGDPRGIYDPTFDWECNYQCHKVKYSNGNVKLNGEQALDLARARGDFGGYGSGDDFGRTERQRQMMVALKDKALSLGTFSNPVTLTKLMDAIGNNVKTDLKPAEVHRAYDLVKDVGSNDITSAGLTTENYLTSYTGGGSSALAPKLGVDNYSDIRGYLKRLLSSDLAAQEDAHVVVLNGSGEVGLADAQAQRLAKTFAIDNIGNADKTYSKTQVYDLTGKKSAAKNRLKSLYHVETVRRKNQLPATLSGYDSDFVIILGSNVTTNRQTN